MEESRRRRKCSGDDSDRLSDVSNEIVIKSHSEQGSDLDNSDYESIEEGQIDDNDEEIAAITTEDKEEKKLDDDEDRKNPQYIPKKGTFYEHDNRLGSENEESNEKTPSETGEKTETKKKIWKENDTWCHDKFNFDDQGPKSQEELIASYGYDIRNEEGPPRARRRRRYARGPTKYTRSWEDQEAYKPTRGRLSAELRRGRSHNINSESDFPSLNSSTTSNRSRNFSEDENYQQGALGSGDVDGSVNDSNHVQSANRRQFRERQNQGYSNYYRDNQNSYRSRGGFNQGGRGDNWKYQQRYNRGSETSYRGRYDRGTYRGKNDRGAYTTSNSSSTDYHEQLEDVTEMLKSTEIRHQKEDLRPNRNEIKKPTVSPRLQEKVNAPNISARQSTEDQSKPTKRYSSQRQRSVADQNASYQHAYYEPEHPKPVSNKPFVQPAYTAAGNNFHSDNYLPTVPAPQIIATPTTHLIAGPPAPIAAVVAGPPIGQTPTATGGPAVTCPPFLATENIINYGPTPGIVAAPPQFPPFQTYPPVPQVPPAEIYRNGVTYYNTQNQQHPRTAPPLQKRPKAAIPILPPPEDDSEIKSEDLESQEQYDDANDGENFSPREYEYVEEYMDIANLNENQNLEEVSINSENYTHEYLVSSSEIPMNSTEIPMNSTEILMNSTEIPMKSTEIPMNSTEMPMNSTEIPMNSTEIPINSTEIPIISTEMADSTTSKLADSSEILDYSELTENSENVCNITINSDVGISDSTTNYESAGDLTANSINDTDIAANSEGDTDIIADSANVSDVTANTESSTDFTPKPETCDDVTFNSETATDATVNSKSGVCRSPINIESVVCSVIKDEKTVSDVSPSDIENSCNINSESKQEELSPNTTVEESGDSPIRYDKFATETKCSNED